MPVTLHKKEVEHVVELLKEKPNAKRRIRTKKARAPTTPTEVAKDRLTFNVLHFFAGVSPREVVAGTERDNKEGRPVSQSTIRALRRPIRDGGTRYPRASTLTRILEAHGASLEVVVKGKIFK